MGSEDFVRGFRGPVLVLHGRHDFIVTWQEQRTLILLMVQKSGEAVDEMRISHGFSAGINSICIYIYIYLCIYVSLSTGFIHIKATNFEKTRDVLMLSLASF